MSTAEIDHMVYCFTTDHDAIPAPFQYEGFPKSVCVSINDVVCHGIPSTEEFLRSGDIVNVDVSTIYKGYFSDASRMYMIGDVRPEMQRLVQVTKSAVTRHTGRTAWAGWAMWEPPSRCSREERLQRSARPLRTWRRHQVPRRTGRRALRQARYGHADSTGHDVHHRADD